MPAKSAPRSMPARGRCNGRVSRLHPTNRSALQGEPIQFLAESHCAVGSYNDFSLSKEQGERLARWQGGAGLQGAGRSDGG
jgi:hypothetical protein